MAAFLDYLPRGASLSGAEFKVRHTFLQWVLALHLPALLAFGLFRGYGVSECVEAIAGPAAFLVLSRLLRSRRLAGLAVTAGLSSCSASLVVLSGGAIEAHFHFFVTIGLIALYQDWVPFAWNALFTVFSHGVGSFVLPSAFFAHAAGQHHPWSWSVIHGVAVLAACAGVMVQMRFVEDDHRRTVGLRAELLEGNRKRFTADLLVNLARRNQNLIYRQLELLNRLEDHEQDAEQLSHLFQLDHLATRIRRNAESLLVLSGEEPARKWGGSVLLVDVVRAAIAEIEELDRVDFSVDESLQVSGRAVADATHLLAELIENAVHFSPPGLSVMIRTRPYLPSPGAQVLTIEDWGVGMPAGDIADANDLLRQPREVDLASAQRLGLHMVARLAARYGISCSLDSTPGGGVTAVVVLPAELFAPEASARTPVAVGASGRRRAGGTRTDDDGPLSAPGSGRSLTGGPSGRTGPNGAGSSGRGPNGVNGSSANGTSANGTSANGGGLNGFHDTGRNGSAVNGSGLDGPGLNGSGPNGSGPNGSGLNGSGLNGSGLNGSGSGAGAGVAGGAGRSGADAAGPNGAQARGGAGLDVPGSASVPDSLEELDAELGSGVGYFGRDADATGLPTPRGDSADEDGWQSWWPLPSGGDDRPAGGPGLPVPDGLARRTPQANLADELRRNDQAEPERPVRPRRDPAETRSALSRFQATQRAAREGRREPGTEGKDRT